MKLEDWLDDLCVRFIINLPREELESVERICFQVEEAQWFYEDFIRPLDPNLPSLNLRNFALLIFQHCPLMSQWSHYHHSTAFSEFLAYKTRVPVRGAILLNESMDEVVLVKGWKKTAGWSFPRGKINKDEKDLDCAAREVYEETGFDIKHAGLIEDEEKVKYIDISMREQNMRLYVIRGVPKDAHFEPRTRKEISKIEWYKLSDLPTQKNVKQEESNGPNSNRNKFYMVAPFLGPLKKWIALQRKRDIPKASSSTAQAYNETPAYATADEGPELASGDILQSDSNIEAPIPTDLSAMPANEDPSAQLKRLLNIGYTMPQAHSTVTSGQTMPDSTKGSVLLELLRKGSDAPSSHYPEQPSALSFPPNTVTPLYNQPFPPFPTQHRDNVIPQPLVTIPGPSLGVIGQRLPNPPNNARFNHQIYQPPAYSTGNSFPELVPENFYRFPQPPSQQIATGNIPGHQGRPPQNNPPWPVQFPANGSVPLEPHSIAGLNQAPQPKLPPPPYYQAMSQSTQIPQPSNFQALSIPPASKLPPPKLNSHSLALLKAFKSDSSQKAAMLSQKSSSTQAESSKRSEHQDNLLKLLKTTAPSSTIPTSTLQGKLTLQPSLLKSEESEAYKIKQNTLPPSQQQSTNMGQKDFHGQGVQVSSAKSPRIETTVKPSLRRPPQQSPVQQAAQKPTVVILPRPSSATKEPLPIAKGPEAPRSPLKKNAKISELTKPFKPRILRRPDKDNLEAYLPTHTVTVSAFTKPKEKTMMDEPERSKETVKELNYDRRQSQSNLQKETLLSLFAKGAPSSEQTVPKSNDVAGQLKSPVESSAFSSPEGPIPQSRGISPLNISEPRPANQARVTSPADKAFLLGYLDGVMKGKR
ncbi:mRNA-decapping enzyme subunit 2 [Emydomyces testavorans]|uniref:mRNA-decapping enzyme subunit 2 n=1 Tax=Emydomyces testavorans TaxID=2070801 RepID=A0AAF0DMM0_9EURO|nr:mRNA-decapping enzyme subunit 2 [Emydomyces testavorans]